MDRKEYPMAQKRIKMIQRDMLGNKIRLLYNDGSQGELDISKSTNPAASSVLLVGLTLKQAKMVFGIKD